MDDFERGTQLKGYMQRETKGHDISSNYGYTYYFCRNFLEKLYGEDPKRFILKGSFSQFANLGVLKRPITDIDVVTDGNIEKANDIIIKLTNTNDKTKYSIKQSFVTTNATINYRILCNFDNIQHLITMDLRKEENLETINIPLVKVFGKDREFNTNSITLEEHLANKIYVSLLNLQLHSKLGKEFRRFKDFYDIYWMLSLGDINEDKLSSKLTYKVKNDSFLKEYDLNGALFSKQFIRENRNLWDEDAKNYQFNESVTFDEATYATNEIISKIRKQEIKGEEPIKTR